MIHLNIWDNNFEGQTSVVPGKSPRFVHWTRNRDIVHPDERTEPTIFTDWTLTMAEPEPEGQFAWLLESPVSKAGKYARDLLPELASRFEAIFTSERKRVTDNPVRYRYAPVGGIWVEKPGIQPKTRFVSMLASTKTDTPMQKLRVEIASRTKADVYGRGRGRSEINRVEDALDNYRFSIVIENALTDGYWTEKLLNCFATGTIPIYAGAPDIGRYFDERGILPLGSLDELTSPLAASRYEKLRPYMIANYHEALRYEIPDDRLALDHFMSKCR